MRMHALGCLIPVAFAVAVPSQATLHAYPPGTTLTAMIAAAAPGDTIVLHQGFYVGFTATRGVNLVVGSGYVIFDPLATSPPLPATGIDLQIPSGETFHIADVESRFPISVSGNARFDSCRMPRLVATGAQLHLQATTVTSYSGYEPVMALQQSSATMVDCSVVASAWGSLAPTVDLAGGSLLHASHCDLRNGNWAATSSAALGVDASSRAWICDSTLATIDSTACVVDGQVRADRCTFVHNGGNCTPPAPGLLLGVTRPAPLQLGAPFSVTFTTEANGFVFVLAAPDLERVDVPQLLEQPSWLPVASVFPAGALLAGVSGTAAASWPIPGNPALLHATLWFEGIGLGSGLLQVSPPVGGMAR